MKRISFNVIKKATKSIIIFKLIIFTIIALSNIAIATELRGRVDYIHPYTGHYQPLPRAEVRLHFQDGRSVAATITGYDGFYYFYNIPPGNYYILINGLKRYFIQVPNLRGYDVPPILF